VQAQEEWMRFRKFDDPRAAQGLCLWLRNEQIAARVEGATVLIQRSQYHRADWIVEHLPPTVEDLCLLATEND
jgi:hypothetical protein